jgi:hypothetical protein
MDQDRQMKTHLWTALNLLLLCEKPLFVTLWEQALVSEWTIALTGAGFRAHFNLPADVPSLPGEPSFTIDDLVSEFPEKTHSATYALFVRTGKLDYLEGSDSSGIWPNDFSKSLFRYVPGGGRIWVRDIDAILARARASCRTTGS